MNAPLNVLIVDDKEANLFALRHVLNNVDCQLIEAHNGNDALIACLNYDFALAILDVNMPGMDGFELAEFMRKEERSRAVPIIFLTAASREESLVFKGYQSGAVDYIVKPYDPQLLLSKVNVFLDLNRAHRELRQHRDELDLLVKERTAELALANQNLLLEIEQRKNTELQLNETVDALKRTNKELEQFAYIASHDLQAPLRTITNFLSLLSRRCSKDLDEKSNDFIQRAINGAGRMQGLIEDLLAYSRTGTRANPLQKTNSGEVLDDVLEAISGLIQDSKAEIHADSLPSVMADPSQLRQVFQNLLTNAIKFQKPEAHPIIHISAKRIDTQWEFSVQDNGIGIEPEFFERIFVIFQRLHGRSTFSGSGIGLSIVKKIIERHGGTIRVESQPNQGAKFIFTLPAA